MSWQDTYDRWEDEHRIVEAMSEAMRDKLYLRRSKGSWDVDPRVLLEALRDEVAELAAAMVDHRRKPSATTKQDVISECADVANYAAMILDLVRQEQVEP